MFKFYFELYIIFNRDYDVEGLQEKFGIKANEIVTFNESSDVEEEKVARFVYQSPEYEDYYASDAFENFVLRAKDKMVGIKEILEENGGEMTFCVVYKDFSDKKEVPGTYLSVKTINALNEMGADFISTLEIEEEG